MGASLSELKPGETVSASDANRFAIAAMANVIHYTREELTFMIKQFGEFAEQTEPKNCMDREQFLAGLEILGTHETDQEILDKMFTLYDETGDEIVPYKEFCCGASVLTRGNVNDKISFAFQLWDYEGKGSISQKDCIKCLKLLIRLWISWRQDIDKQQISHMVENIYSEAELNADNSLDYVEYVSAICNHPTLVNFLTQ